MNVEQLATQLSLTIFSMPSPTTPVTGGYAGDLLSWVMGNAKEGQAWITIMSNHNVAAVTIMLDLPCVILAEGVTPDETLLKRAQEQEINLFGTSLSTFEIVGAMAPLLS